MKTKTKKFAKKYLIGFTLGLISGSLVMVYAETYFPSNQVTYENTASGMQSTDVQGAIDELYNTCFPKTGGDTILDNTDIVTSGDGLYADEYEEGKYTYKGANPNNYVTFNNEKAGWRIISINSDGTIKIMRDASIGNMAWDSSNSSNWNRPASLNTYLNSTYYNSLTSETQSQIVAKDFSIGVAKYSDTNLSNTINSENSKKWNGKVALPTASEYVRSNSDKSNCGTMQKVWSATSGQCSGTTWMHNNDDWWTVSPLSDDRWLELVRTSGNFDYYGGNANEHYGVRPVLYLSSEVKITGGDGSQSNPYTIE